MMRKAIPWLALAACILSASVPLLAHHGTAVFDNDKKLTLKATVTEWYLVQSTLPAAVRRKGRERTTGALDRETQNPVTMVDGGWGKTSFKPGDEVTVTLNPVKNGQPMGRIITVLLPDGKLLNATAGIRNYK